MEAYSLDLRQRICAACDERTETPQEVADRFGVCRWFVQEPQLKDIKTPDGEGNSTEEHHLLKSVEALGAKHLVFGHQPGEVKFGDGTTRAQGQMYAKYHGLALMIDTSMSRGVQSGKAALLRIRPIDEHPSATAIYIDGTTTLLWP